MRSFLRGRTGIPVCQSVSLSLDEGVKKDEKKKAVEVRKDTGSQAPSSFQRSDNGLV